jgi:hypothetical protein
MGTSRRFLLDSILALALSLSLSACGREPLAPTSTLQFTGHIVVALATTGGSFDIDGFAVSVDGGAAPLLDHNRLLTLQVPAGEHTLTLSGTAPNCSVDGPSRTVFVGDKSTVNLVFNATCRPDPALSPIRLVYGRSTNNVRANLVAVNGDGSGRVQLTTGYREWAPAVSPDGKRIAFVGSREGDLGIGPQIYLMNSDGTGLTLFAGNAGDPSWFPDGKSLVFSFGGMLYRAWPDGSKPMAGLTDIPWGVASPVVSPDGSRIAFVRYEGIEERPSLWLVNADGSGLTRLSEASSSTVDGIAWSHDGRHILWSQYDGWAVGGTPRGRINLLDPDGLDSGTLLEVSSAPVIGEVSDDGSHLLFAMNADVYLLRLADKSLTRLTADHMVWGTPAFARSR